jgi:hypothetical protein
MRTPDDERHRALMAAALAVSERLREHEMRRMAGLRDRGGVAAAPPSPQARQRSSSSAPDGAVGAAAGEPAS